MSTRLEKMAVWYASLLLGVIPLVIVPGIDEYTLLPRLAILQFLSLLFSLFVVSEVFAGRHTFGSSFPELSLFWVFLAGSVLWALNPFRSTFDLAKHAAVFTSFLLLANTLSRQSIPRILSVHAITGILVSLIGMAEYFDVSAVSIPSTGRPSSTFGFRNLAGAYLAAGIPIAFLLRLIGRDSTERALGVLSSSTMMIFLAYTRARASWFGLLAGTGAAILLYWLTRRPTIRPGTVLGHWRSILPFAVAAIVATLPDNLAERHTQRFDEKKADLATTLGATFKRGGDRGRFDMWACTLDQIADYPILGVGLGNWEYVYPLYDDGAQVSPGHSPHRPHNDVLWIWSETGTVGLVAFLALLLAIGRRSWRICRGPEHWTDVSIACCALASMVAVLGVGMFSFPWERVPPELLFWISVALVWAVSPKERPRSSGSLQIVLLALLIVLGLGITIRHIRFDERYIKAHVAFQLKDFEGAGRFAAEALENGVFEHQALVILGESHYQKQEWDLAEASYSRVFEYHPNFANAYNGLGLVEYGRGNYERALERFEQARKIIPNHYIATYNKGLVFEAMGQVDSAIAAYRNSFHSDHTKPFINLGAIYRKLGLVDSAIALYSRAANDPIPSAEAWFNLGNVYADQKDFIASAEAFAQFLNRWTKDDSVRTAAIYGLSQAYSGFGVQAEMRGSVDSARTAYRKAIEINPDEPINWFNLGNILRRDGKLEDAMEAYEKAIARDAQHLDSYNNLGMTYRDLGRTEDAIRTYRRASELAPESAILNYNLGHALLEIGDTQKAEEALATFRRTWDSDPALIHFYMGNAYAEYDRVEEAKREYRAFLASWSQDDDLRKSAERILQSISGGASP